MKLFRIPMLGSVLLWAILTQLLLCRNGVFAGNGTKACKLQDESASQRKVLERLEPLAGKNFSVTVKEEKESYRYVFQLCGDAGGVQKAGVIQQTDSQAKPTIVGSYTSTKAIGGSDWVMLIYHDGDKYDSHCNNEARKAIIMISCNKNKEGDLEVILEDRDRQSDCFYLFELDSSAVCPPVQSQLSAGSIILIIGFCLVAVYLIGGFLYQRLIVGAKGMEQFPNYAFWVEVGNLSADGCDFVCRSKNREEAPAYRGVTADALDEEPEERDDHLLPM
ncbi:cation-dependent mannose-6-phosphate receptor isoform X1 [Xiphophorus couchianus]|uniref:cation-dependent mannose-6-phosphate receptor isoform X1 n=2 Tax=Xiphophorus couchianus TaxID=32473 RepID=UPI00101712E3|nr:cation-dependent mannose-6-phosphate receptor isoform X1 [Xiphophorus couchianus]